MSNIKDWSPSVAGNAVAYDDIDNRDGVARVQIKYNFRALLAAISRATTWVTPEMFGAVGYPAGENWAALSSADQATRIAQAPANLAALIACQAFSETRLAAVRYYISNVLPWSAPNTRLTGAGVNYGLTTCSEIILCGTNAATTTIFQFGANSYATVARGQYVEGVNFGRTVVANGSTTGDAADCVKGVLYTNTTNSEMRRCRVFGSPVGFHVTQTATSNLIDCNVAPVASSANDISIGYLIGDYTTYPGFVGANGSLRAEGNTAFAFPGSTYTAHTLLFGLPADTWIDKAEGSGGKVGIDVCGLAKSDMITYLASGGGSTILGNGGSCQDITISNSRMDGCSGIGFYFHQLNSSASLNVHNLYQASSPTGIAASNIAGRVNITDGEILASGTAQGGVDVASVGCFTLRGTLIRDKSVPLRINGLVGAVVEPRIYNPSGVATTGVTVINSHRCRISPAITGGASTFTNGITLDSASGYNEVNGSAIDPGAFAVVDKQYKVRFNGADASAGSGATAFAAAGNVLTGVTG